MSLRTKVLRLVEVVLRVPPLFIIDEILKVGIVLTDFTEHDLSGFEHSFEDNATNGAPTVHYDPTFYKLVVATFFRFTLCMFGEVSNQRKWKCQRCHSFLFLLGCIASLCLFVLNTRHLMIVYMYLMSIGVVLVSYWSNVGMMKLVLSTAQSDGESLSMLDHILSLNVKELADPAGYPHPVIQNYFVQCILTFIFVNIHLGPRYSFVQKLIPVSFMAPSVLAILPVPKSVLHHTPVFAALLPLALVKFVLWASVVSIVQTLYSGYMYAKNFISNFGLSALVEAEWLRLCVPEVLRTFWILRALEHTGIFFISGFWSQRDDGLTPVFRLVKSVMVSGCETLTAVLGVTSIVSYICNNIGRFFQWILLTDENDKNIGTVSAILFYILALQTGLTSLEPDKRFIRLCRNFCLLCTALLHFIHNIVNPLLMSLSASHNPSFRRHSRALMVSGFLILFPILLMYYLWTNHEVSTWLLAVSAFSIEVIVKVAVSLSIYSLFLLDARKETFWEKLDDYVYYIRAFGNTVEFCFGIFLFFNGLWILIFESGGAIRAVMMCIHAYFNIWCEARAGWVVFMKRRTAVHKIESLPEAEEAQLQRLDDVCAICYQEMRSAKITRCKHFFHGVCLRKWLYVQDRCPLCHEVLHGVDCNGHKHRSQPMEDEDVNLNR